MLIAGRLRHQRTALTVSAPSSDQHRAKRRPVRTGLNGSKTRYAVYGAPAGSGSLKYPYGGHGTKYLKVAQV